MTGTAAEESPGPCRCHRSFAYISDMHPGHCCFWPEGQDCHQAEVAAWEAERDRRDRRRDTMTETGPELHTYMVQRFRMKADWPLTFSDGEQIVAVLRSDVVPGGVSNSDQMDLVVLVELPTPGTEGP